MTWSSCLHTILLFISICLFLPKAKAEDFKSKVLAILYKTDEDDEGGAEETEEAADEEPAAEEAAEEPAAHDAEETW